MKVMLTTDKTEHWATAEIDREVAAHIAALLADPSVAAKFAEIAGDVTSDELAEMQAADFIDNLQTALRNVTRKGRLI